MPHPIDLSAAESTYFEPFLHETFSASAWEGPSDQPRVGLELVRVVPYHLGGPEGRRAPFALIFEGPADASLAQGLYTVTHPVVGEMLIFLVPAARRGERIELHAAFN